MCDLKMFLYCFSAIVAFTSAATIQNNDCLLALPKLRFFAPLIFTTNGVLKSTETLTNVDDDNPYVVRIPAGEKIILSCAPNYLANIGRLTQSIEATCKGGEVLTINGESYNFLKKLNCQVRAIEEILHPLDICPSPATSVEYGFTHPSTQKSIVLGEACYNEKEGRTLFAHTTFKGDFKNYDLEKVALHLSDANHFKQAHPESQYKLSFLRAMNMRTLNAHLETTLGKNNIPILVQHNLIGPELLVNYQFYNVFKLGWNYVMLNGEPVAELLEGLYADVANKLKYDKTSDIYVGTSGILSLPNKAGILTEVYMSEDKKFPIAKYIWLVVQNENKVVAFVVPNVSHQNESVGLHKEQAFCPNKCSQLTWLKHRKTVEAVSNGHLICCEFMDFSKKVT